MTVLLTPDVTVFIHPIDTQKCQTSDGSWRWAVHAGGQSPSNLLYCVNAGRAPTRQLAAVIGESHGAAVTKALRIFQMITQYHGVVELDYDPTPNDALAHVWRDTARVKG